MRSADADIRADAGSSESTFTPLDREPTLWEVAATLRKKELYGNLAVHVFILIPAAVVMAILGRTLDRNWGLPRLPGPPWNILGALVCFAVGGAIVWYAYGYLHLKGGGSPGSHMGYTQRLVTTGIYSWVRHPSNVGKLIGVIGLGLLLRTPGFILVIVPALFLYSILTTVVIQERFCVRNFGEAYLRYKAETPMFVPRWRRVRQAWRERTGR